MPDENAPNPRRDRTLEYLERAAPWIMVGIVTVLVLTGLLAAILGAPWAR